ncbi:hypothetical protein, partial [Cupriavidus numazuensis]
AKKSGGLSKTRAAFPLKYNKAGKAQRNTRPQVPRMRRLSHFRIHDLRLSQKKARAWRASGKSIGHILSTWRILIGARPMRNPSGGGLSLQQSQNTMHSGGRF